MAKKLDIESTGMMNDFETPKPRLENNEVTVKRQRRRIRQQTVRVSAYFTPDEYRMLDELAAQNDESLTRTLSRAIKLLYNRNQKLK